MGNSTEKATQKGEKVYAVLRAKGRPHYEAKRDAESWVLGNYGLKVAIHPAQGTDGTEHHHNAPRPTCQVCGSPTPPPGWICFNCWTKARNTAQKEQAAGDRKNMRRERERRVRRQGRADLRPQGRRHVPGRRSAAGGVCPHRVLADDGLAACHSLHAGVQPLCADVRRAPRTPSCPSSTSAPVAQSRELWARAATPER